MLTGGKARKLEAGSPKPFFVPTHFAKRAPTVYSFPDSTIPRILDICGWKRPGPINILATPQTPPIPELQRLGIARVSFGSGGYRTAIGAFRKLVQESIDSGTYTFMSEIAVTGAQNNALHQPKS